MEMREIYIDDYGEALPDRHTNQTDFGEIYEDVGNKEEDVKTKLATNLDKQNDEPAKKDKKDIKRKGRCCQIVDRCTDFFSQRSQVKYLLLAVALLTISTITLVVVLAVVKSCNCSVANQTVATLSENMTTSVSTLMTSSMSTTTIQTTTN